MTPSDLMAQAVEAAAETHTTVAWLNIAADALANAQRDPTMSERVRDTIARTESNVLLVLYAMRGGL